MYDLKVRIILNQEVLMKYPNEMIGLVQGGIIRAVFPMNLFSEQVNGISLAVK